MFSSLENRGSVRGCRDPINKITLYYVIFLYIILTKYKIKYYFTKRLKDAFMSESLSRKRNTCVLVSWPNAFRAVENKEKDNSGLEK